MKRVTCKLNTIKCSCGIAKREFPSCFRHFRFLTMAVRVEINNWKKLSNGETVKQVELSSETGFKVRLLSLGATLQSVVYPGERGGVREGRRPGLWWCPGIRWDWQPIFLGNNWTFYKQVFYTIWEIYKRKFQGSKEELFQLMEFLINWVWMILATAWEIIFTEVGRVTTVSIGRQVCLKVEMESSLVYWIIMGTRFDTKNQIEPLNTSDQILLNTSDSIDGIVLNIFEFRIYS